MKPPMRLPNTNAKIMYDETMPAALSLQLKDLTMSARRALHR